MNLILPIIIYFEQCLGVNLELLYFISILLIVKDILKNRGILLIKNIYYMYFIILYAVLQIPILGYINIGETIIFISKIFLCMYIFVYTKENVYEFDIKKITWNLAILYSISVPLSIILKNSNLLWRHNDLINKYSTTRLQLFYFEPSELSLYVSITIILFIGFWNQYKQRNLLKIVILILLFNTLILTKGMGGIGLLVATLITMYILYVFNRNTIFKNLISICITSALIIGSVLFITSDNPMALRMNDIISGKDPSVNYRYGVGKNVMIAALENTKGIGVGFGNLNSPQVVSIYSQYGLIKYIANSFMYFITEGGIFALLYLIIFIGKLIIDIISQKSILKFGLLMFIIIYQVAGGYMTNPLIWLIYGIIGSKELRN